MQGSNEGFNVFSSYTAHDGEHATGVAQSNAEQFLSYDHSPTVDRT